MIYGASTMWPVWIPNAESFIFASNSQYDCAGLVVFCWGGVQAGTVVMHHNQEERSLVFPTHWGKKFTCDRLSEWEDSTACVLHTQYRPGVR